MKARVLTHHVQIDGVKMLANGMSLVSLREDDTFDIEQFDGKETHSTFFVSGVLQITTDGYGHALSLSGENFEIKIDNRK